MASVLPVMNKLEPHEATATAISMAAADEEDWMRGEMPSHLLKPNRFETTGRQVDFPKVGFPAETSFDGQRKLTGLSIG